MGKRIAVIGHACLDLSVQIDHIPEPGELAETEPIIWSVGGVVSNTGLALAKMGQKVDLVAKIGTDDFGQKLRSVYESFDNACALLTTSENDATSFSVVLVPGPDKKQDRAFIHHSGANSTFSADNVPYRDLKGCIHAHFGYLPLMQKMYQNHAAETVRMLANLKSMGLTTSMDMVKIDPSSPTAKEHWWAILRNVLPFIDFFVPSYDEMTDITMLDPKAGYSGWQNMAKQFISLGCKAVMLKLGKTGLYLRTSDAQIGQLDNRWLNRELISRPFEEPGSFKSALGSGDVSIAGFLIAMTRGYHPENALELANGASSCSVEAVDPLSALRSLTQIQLRIDSGWPILGENSFEDLVPLSCYRGVFRAKDDTFYDGV